MSKILVVGGGVAGLSAADALAELGHDVELVEKEASLGGLAGRLDLTFPNGIQGGDIVS